MRIELRLSLRIERKAPPEPPEFEHRDTEALVEHSGPQPLGFVIPPHERWTPDEDKV